MPPSVSVVIPVYNRFEQLKRSVESVLAQTWPVSEVILIDDGSYDGTSEMLPEYVAQNERWRERIRYFHQRNQGAGAARNLGVVKATGEWLAFNDNDDLWLPQKLEWQFRALDKFQGQCSLCFTDAWFMNNPHMKMTLFQLAGKPHCESVGMIPDPLKYLLDINSIEGIHPVWLQNLLVRTEIARRAGGFDPALPFGDDDDFVFRLGCETKFCFVNLPMVLIDRKTPTERHVGAQRAWEDADFHLRMAQARMEKRLRMNGRFAADICRMVRRDLAAVHSGWTNWYLARGQYKDARKSIIEAARLHLRPGIAAKLGLTVAAPIVARMAVNRRAARRQQRTMGFA
jgi:glycosyltransferase involved in cell wall biosynthesis